MEQPADRAFTTESIRKELPWLSSRGERNCGHLEFLREKLGQRRDGGVVCWGIEWLR
jgi:hypothetical protein